MTISQMTRLWCLLSVIGSSLSAEQPADHVPFGADGSCSGDWCRPVEGGSGICTYLNVFYRTNQSDDAELDYTRAAVHPGCVELHLGFSHPGWLGDVGAKSLAAELHRAPNLERLEIGSNHVGDEGVKALALALEQHQKLKYLGISVSLFGKAGAGAIAKLLRHSPIVWLDLGSNTLGTAIVCVFAPVCPTARARVPPLPCHCDSAATAFAPVPAYDPA